ncbi:hypothetical protein ACIGXM_03260 [Kitasatospora sp. NPDC052896]|uniref:hypothetical protein n=1 Tax=Kitasatospora sp. NPDC052896 TaxID=3364061 RepID=UPI0037C8D6D9
MSGPLRLVPDEGTPGWAEETMRLRELPRRRRPGAPSPAEDAPELSPDPIDELAERLADVCADAVHPYEIAAFLESDGLTDEQAALNYGRPDSFALAEELFAKVARRYPAPVIVTGADPWRADPWRCVLRGLVFALPGLGYLLASGFFAAHRLRFGLPSGLAAMAAATLVSWAWNQGLAHRSYGWLSRTNRRAAGRALALGAPAGALLAAATGYLVGGPLAALWFIAGQSLYLAAATVLLVLGQEKLLLAALTPSVVGTGLVLGVRLPGTARSAILLATLACAVGLAVWQLVRCLRTEPTAGGSRPPRHETLGAGLFGLSVGTLTLFAGLGASLQHGLRPGTTGHPGSTGPVLVALTLSLGLAEWLLYRYRSLATAALRTSLSPGHFRRRTGLVLAGCLGGYLAVVGLLDLAATLLWPHTPSNSSPTGPLTAVDLLLLAATLWTALLLQALGLVWRTTGLCAAAAVAESTALLSGADPLWVQLYGCGAAAVLLVLLATVVLGRTTTHR